jgi:hypothetical protein
MYKRVARAHLPDRRQQRASHAHAYTGGTLLYAWIAAIYFSSKGGKTELKKKVLYLKKCQNANRRIWCAAAISGCDSNAPRNAPEPTAAVTECVARANPYIASSCTSTSTHYGGSNSTHRALSTDVPHGTAATDPLSEKPFDCALLVAEHEQR